MRFLLKTIYIYIYVFVVVLVLFSLDRGGGGGGGLTGGIGSKAYEVEVVVRNY